MKIETIEAYSPEEAVQKATEMGYNVRKVYKFSNLVKWHEFSKLKTKIMGMARLTKLKKWNVLDTAIVVEKVKGIPERKLWPWEYINHVRKGKCKLERCVEIRTKLDDRVVATAPTKTEALRLAKEVIRTEQQDLYAKTIYISKDIDFELNYKRGWKSRLGEYLIFSVDLEDLRVYNIHHRKDPIKDEDQVWLKKLK